MHCKTKKQYRQRRHMRLRKKVAGTRECPRMAVMLSLSHIYVQFIDDDAGHTLAAASTMEKAFTGKPNMEGAALIGKMAAEKATAAGIKTVVFDRGGFSYHGRVKAIADAAREAGLQF